MADYSVPRAAASLGPTSASGVVPDRSGNGYDARIAAGVLRTPLGSKGHNYTLLLRAQLGAFPGEGALLAGPDDSFGLALRPGGALTFAFTSSNITYLLSNFTLPPRSDKDVTDVILTGTEGGTAVYVDGVHAGDFLVPIDGTDTLEPMAFVAPVEIVGRAGIHIYRITLWDGIQDVSGIANQRYG